MLSGWLVDFLIFLKTNMVSEEKRNTTGAHRCLNFSKRIATLRCAHNPIVSGNPVNGAATFWVKMASVARQLSLWFKSMFSSYTQNYVDVCIAIWKETTVYSTGYQPMLSEVIVSFTLEVILVFLFFRHVQSIRQLARASDRGCFSLYCFLLAI